MLGPEEIPAGARTPDRARPETPEAGIPWAGNVRDEDAWDACILALDGGGIRGYSSCLILRRLMHYIYEWEKKLEDEDPLGIELVPEDDLQPCHYFDLFYGTSTGGLIAVMLSRLRMTIGECLEKYRLVGEQLFGKRKSIVPLRTKYRHEPLEEAVRDMLKGRGLDEDELHPWYVILHLFSFNLPTLCLTGL